MPDREKIIQGLQELADYLFYEYKVCYHGDKEDCYNRFLQADNALNLLKEQEAVAPLIIDDAVSELIDRHNKRLKEQEAVVLCKDCIKRKTNSCLMYWNGIFDDETWDDDWFCADGKRKE